MPKKKTAPRVVIGLPASVPDGKAWWWHRLDEWSDLYDRTPGEFRDRIEFKCDPRIQVIEHLRWASETPLIGEVLDGYLSREIEHRINGGEKWCEFPEVRWHGSAHHVVKRADAAATPLEITVTIRADASTKAAAAVFLEAFKQARAAVHLAAPPLTPSNRIRSENTWRDVFKVIELIDRRLDGKEVDNDEFAQARAFLRERNLVLKDSRARR